MADIDEIFEEINNDPDPYSCFICGKAILPQDRYYFYMDRTLCGQSCVNGVHGYMIDMAEYQCDDTFREETK